MNNRIYKKAPLKEMYMAVHFQADPPVASLDLHQFSKELKADFVDPQYMFPIIESVGPINKIPIEPEKVSLDSKDKTKLIQLGRDRMVYNWLDNNTQTVIYPKYENIKTDFFNYWNKLSNYINKYPDRKLNIKLFELYYSNILPIGKDCFLKKDTDLHKALNFISPYPINYKTVIPHITLQIPFEQDILYLRLDRMKNNKDNSTAFLLTFSMRSGINQDFDKLSTDWYNKANQNIRKFFEDITTDSIKQFWKGEG